MTANSPSLRVGLLGLGAVGTLMAGHWHRLQPVCLPRAGRHAAAQQRRLQWLNGQQQMLQLPVWQGTGLDWLVVTTKAADTLPALQQWAAQLPAVDRILLLQNGMGQQQACADWLQQQGLPCRLWAGISTEGAYLDTAAGQPPRVVHAGAGNTLAGPWQEDASGIALPPAVTAVADIRQPMREKLAINAVINPLTALFRCRNGELVSNRRYHTQLLALAQETATLSEQLGWSLSEPLEQRAEAVARATAANRSSTLQDILAGRPTELPWITGYLLHCAHKAGVPAPLNSSIYQQLQEHSDRSS